MWASQHESTFFIMALVVQAAAILSVVIARLGQREESQVRYERFFYACLALVATICLLATWTGTGSWIMNGFTLATMAVGATIDLGNTTPETVV